jgi:hypothetical protein
VLTHLSCRERHGVTLVALSSVEVNSSIAATGAPLRSVASGTGRAGERVIRWAAKDGMRIAFLLLATALLSEPTSAASCKVVKPAKESEVWQKITIARLPPGARRDKSIRIDVSFLAVCGEWALLDSVMCAPDCPEGGYSLFRRVRGKWKELPLPEIEDCDPMESPFITPQNGCLAATIRRYPTVPRKLMLSVND